MSSDQFDDCKRSCEDENPYGTDMLAYKTFKFYWRIEQHLQEIISAREGIVMELDCTGSMCMFLFYLVILHFTIVV